MAALIEDLLAYSRLERVTLESAAIDLREMVDKVLAEQADEVTASGAELVVDLPAVKIRGDRQGVLIVLRNLLQNALKFSRETDSPRIELRGRIRQDKLLLSVADNGIGFDMRYHERIFEIFQRLNQAERYPGTGVGLALVRKAVQRMGGRVWAESEPGEGARFWLEFTLEGPPAGDSGRNVESP
jgi:signal transduction histidine kinase